MKIQPLIVFPPRPGHLTRVLALLPDLFSVVSENQLQGGSRGGRNQLHLRQGWRQGQLLTPCRCQILLSNTAVPILQSRKPALREDKAMSSPRSPI